ncbi:uncharacterized protein LTHEOB_9036 [Lasiodiplodia theobromae]|nr:uncharacterized protein LTHEOB_9036 [Lasiodiplodia theobromae]KAF4540365.1 hypothetical protein LTHEOB_9036 [Lasiodiplodia theobromae]
MIHPESEGPKPIPQVVYYQSGVGTTTHSALDYFTSGGVGVGLEDNVLTAYHYLSTNYSPADGGHAADEIFLFGFSRGAFTARALAGLVTELGLMKPEYLNELQRAYALYRKVGNMAGQRDVGNIRFMDKVNALASLLQAEDYQLLSELHRDANDEPRKDSKMYSKVKIKAVGVWDTVGALGIPDSWLSERLPWINGQFKFHDAALNSRIENAFQALALDEHRGAFKPTLWYLDDKFIEDKKYPNLKQCWFPGFHESIGGGDTLLNHWLTKMLPESEMHDITLAWMCDQIDGLVHFDGEACRKILLGDDADRVNWATAYEVDVVNLSLQIFRLNILGGSRIRTPGMYHVNNAQWAARTNETMHPSVHYRIEATRRQWVPYDPPALGGNLGFNVPLLPQVGTPRWRWEASATGNGAVWVRPAVPALWPLHPREEPRRELSEWVIREVHGKTNFEAALLPPRLKQRLRRRNDRLINEAAAHSQQDDVRMQYWTRTTWGPAADKVGGKMGARWLAESLMAGARGVGEREKERLGEVVVHAGVREAVRHGHDEIGGLVPAVKEGKGGKKGGKLGGVDGGGGVEEENAVMNGGEVKAL